VDRYKAAFFAGFRASPANFGQSLSNVLLTGVGDPNSDFAALLRRTAATFLRRSWHYSCRGNVARGKRQHHLNF
jgi:hypothetical protein